MKEYEIVWEIFNNCSNNQMRDVQIDELEVADPDVYVQNKFKGKDVTWEKDVLSDGTIIYEIDASGIRERISFTEI